MTRILPFLLAAAFLAQQPVAPERKPAATEDGISVYFSPDGGCTNAIIHEIDKARKIVRVQAYAFTSAPIAKSILNAKKRGVKIVVLMESGRATGRYSSATFFDNQGIPVFLDKATGLAHNKVILVDEEVIITGSFNFSKAAEQTNRENLLVIKGKKKLMAAYLANFERHLTKAEEYERPEESR